MLNSFSLLESHAICLKLRAAWGHRSLLGLCQLPGRCQNHLLFSLSCLGSPAWALRCLSLPLCRGLSPDFFPKCLIRSLLATRPLAQHTPLPWEGSRVVPPGHSLLLPPSTVFMAQTHCCPADALKKKPINLQPDCLSSTGHTPLPSPLRLIGVVP